jgi:RNA polymerase sigma-70 factor, ECF subfamily
MLFPSAASPATNETLQPERPWRVTDSGGDNLPERKERDLDALFEQVIRDHGPRLQAIARGIVGRRFAPEDVVQQAVSNLYEHRHRYDWSQPLPLVRRAVVNEALRLLRRPTMGVLDQFDMGEEAPPDANLVQNETVQQVRKAIDQLPNHFRAALVLCEYEGLSYPEIARDLGITIQQTKTWIFRARRQLEQKLAEFVKSGRSVQ